MTFIESTLDSNPSIYLDELQKRLDDTRNIKVSIATLSCALRSLQYSQKSEEQTVRWYTLEYLEDDMGELCQVETLD
jgi:hypothetical protein